MRGGPSRRETLQLLSSVTVGGLAGCMAAEPDVNAEDAAPPGTDGTSSAFVAGLSLSARVLQSFTRDHPGRIEVELNNRSGDPVAMGTVHGIEGPLSVIEGARTGGDGTLVIFGDPNEPDHQTPPGAPCRSGGDAIPETPADGCWRPACEYSKLHSHYAITVPAESSLTWPYVVLDGFNDPCLPPGTYEFVQTSPVTRLRTATLGGTTPTGGWSAHVTKRLRLNLDSDGGLTAAAFLEETT